MMMDELPPEDEEMPAEGMPEDELMGMSPEALLGEEEPPYESAGPGINSRLEHRQTQVGPAELADILGPEEGQGYGSSDSDGYLDSRTGLGDDSGADTGSAPPGTMAVSEMSEADRQGVKDMLAVRAQERLAASKFFQEKASAMGKPGGSY